MNLFGWKVIELEIFSMNCLSCWGKIFLDYGKKLFWISKGDMGGMFTRFSDTDIVTLQHNVPLQQHNVPPNNTIR